VRLFAAFYLQMSAKTHRPDRSVAQGAIQLKDEVFFNNHKKSRNTCGRYGLL